MIPIEQIIARKISDRFCRRELRESVEINGIVRGCCHDLNLDIPEVIFCETLTRTSSAFYLRNKPFLIYDSCLLEALYIYDSIILSNRTRDHDLEKLFYKLVGEELLLCKNLPKSLYFSGKYRATEYLFEENMDSMHNKVRGMVSAQSYFLIGHELQHLSLNKANETVPSDFCRYSSACMQALNNLFMRSQSEEKFLKDHYMYFMEECPKSIDEYYDRLWNSKRYKIFLEECYCDLCGLKLLLEHYDNAELSVRAISAAMNFLILQELIRSDISSGVLLFHNKSQDVPRNAYFSVQRMMYLLITLQFNGLTDAANEYRKIQTESMIKHYWQLLVDKIPSEESFQGLSERDLPNVDRRDLIDSLISNFYFISIG